MQIRLTRRQRWALILVVVGVMFLPILPHPPLVTGAYVQNVVDGNATVAMVTAGPSTLEVVAEPVGGGRPARGESSGLQRRHGIELTGLEADTTYRYKVKDAAGGAVLDEGSFRTAPTRDESAVHFAVIGDSGGLPWWVWLQDTPALYLPASWGWLDVKAAPTRVGAAAAADRPDFWIHTGDVVYPKGKQEHWGPAFFRPFAEVNRHAPCYAVLGNHDVVEDEGRQFLKNLHLPSNGPSADERLWSFAYGPVRVIAMDCNQRMTPEHPSVVWLEEQLKAATEPWVVVTSHYPIYSASRQKDRPDMVEHILPLLEQYQVDLYVCGHDHNYQRFGDQRPLLVVSGGGGKSIYALRDHPELAYGFAGYSYATVQTSVDRFTLRAFDSHKNQLEQVELELSRGPVTWEKLATVNPMRAQRIAALLGR